MEALNRFACLIAAAAWRDWPLSRGMMGPALCWPMDYLYDYGYTFSLSVVELTDLWADLFEANLDGPRGLRRSEGV